MNDDANADNERIKWVAGYESDMYKISCLEGHVTAVMYFHQTYNPGLVVRKISHKPKLRVSLQNAWLILPQIVMIMKKQGKTGKLSQTGGD